MKYFQIVLGFTLLPGIWPIKENSLLDGNPPIGVRIGGVMTGVIVHLEGKSTYPLGQTLPNIQMRVNPFLPKDRQMYWTSGRGMDPRVDCQLKFFHRNLND